MRPRPAQRRERIDGFSHAKRARTRAIPVTPQLNEEHLEPSRLQALSQWSNLVSIRKVAMAHEEASAGMGRPESPDRIGGTIGGVKALNTRGWEGGRSQGGTPLGIEDFTN